ncbi:hypothetical protein NVP1063O_121 [Vibrio phage 1.063.O._10N.261.45.C7]|nr:hypothetical protein NVP1063O_121 [Vibrio phage 1.063.O._10N.261.45.C7]
MSNTTCNCNLTIEEKARNGRLTYTEVMAQESVEITVHEYLESMELYKVTIHDNHYDFEVYISKSNLEEYDEQGLVLNSQDI